MILTHENLKAYLNQQRKGLYDQYVQLSESGTTLVDECLARLLTAACPKPLKKLKVGDIAYCQMVKRSFRVTSVNGNKANAVCDFGFEYKLSNTDDPDGYYKLVSIYPGAKHINNYFFASVADCEAFEAYQTRKDTVLDLIGHILNAESASRAA